MFGGSSQLPTTAEHAVIKSNRVQFRQQVSDYSKLSNFNPTQSLVKINAPIKFKRIVMVMIIKIVYFYILSYMQEEHF